MSTPLERMREKVARLNAAADAYYGARAELMTDFEWDALFDEVRALEAETGVVLPDSPTHRVSADRLAGGKEAHEFAALSLAKTKSVAEVAKWAEGRPIWLSWKLDGLTLVVTYDGGRLTKVVTRGDGHVGTNVTHLAPGIAGLPERIAETGHLVVRGEAVISYADFAAFVASSEEEYANPRNLASGSLTLKDPQQLVARRLRWIPFTLVSSGRELPSWGERMDYLDSLGFRCVMRERLDAPDVAALQAAVDRWTQKVLDRSNPYPVDGLVVTYDDVAYAQTGSVTGHHATRAGFAFKWQDETAATELDHVEWSCAVAAITPVAVFRPVSLEGTTVRRASLCNVSECERLGLGGKGTRIEVIKANKIIPKVVRVVEKAGEFEIPATCPVCGAATALIGAETGAKKLTCTSGECPARRLAKFERFVSKEGMDVDGLAGETLARFIALGWIRTPGDVYRLGAHAAEMAELEGFGAKRAENVCAAVEKARQVDAVRFLVALSIPLVGPDVARRLLGAYPLRELLAKAAEAARGDDLFASGEDVFAGLEGIGPAKSAAFVRWMGERANRELVEDLLGEVKVTESPKANAQGACAGLTFVITGDVHEFRNRDEFKAYVLSAGGKVAGSVSAKTDFLVNNDAASSSAKNRKARELGIAILTEAEFLARFGGDR